MIVHFDIQDNLGCSSLGPCIDGSVLYHLAEENIPIFRE